MASTPEPPRRTPVLAVRTAAGRFKSAAAGRPTGRADELRRFRAAQRRLQPPEQRFEHLRTLHD